MVKNRVITRDMGDISTPLQELQNLKYPQSILSQVFSLYFLFDRQILITNLNLIIHIMFPDGTWRSFSDINSELKKANTHLTRSKILRANSGRYVDEI